jgi:hypothetical protein
VCRGGIRSGLELAFQNGSLRVGFRRAAKPANQGVEPGTCALPGRALTENDPDVLRYVPPAGSSVSVSLSELKQAETPLAGDATVTVQLGEVIGAAVARTFFGSTETFLVERSGAEFSVKSLPAITKSALRPRTPAPPAPVPQSALRR